MKKLSFFVLLTSILVSLPSVSFMQTPDLSPKEQKMQEELSNMTLPNLPEQDEESTVNISDDTSLDALNIDSSQTVSQESTVPNEGNPYFTLSGGLAPYQASIGILKYFITEWWGQLDINLTFLPTIPVEDYYAASSFYKPFVAFRVITGWSFYSYRIFEMSLIAQVQVAFISSTDIPILPSLGFRFTVSFFYLDIGVSYAVTVGGGDKDDNDNDKGTEDQIFSGWYPAITLGFRF